MCATVMDQLINGDELSPGLAARYLNLGFVVKIKACTYTKILSRKSHLFYCNIERIEFAYN